MVTRILTVEKDAAIALDLEDLLTEAGYRVDIAATPKEAYESTQQNRPDLALIDLDLSGSFDGIELALRLHEDFDVDHVYVSAYPEREAMAQANHTDPLGYLVKPFNESQLLACIQVALCRNRRRCAAAMPSRLPPPFILDAEFRTSRLSNVGKDACPMESQCSAKLV